jgi:hypothetical protein
MGAKDLPTHHGGLAFDHLLRLRRKQAFRCWLHFLPFLSRLGQSRLASLLSSSRPASSPLRSCRLWSCRLPISRRLLRRIWHLHDQSSLSSGGGRSGYMKSCCPKGSRWSQFIIIIIIILGPIS